MRGCGRIKLLFLLIGVMAIGGVGMGVLASSASADASINPISGFDFGRVALNQPKTQTFTLTDNGTAPITVNSPTFDNGSFTQTNNTCPTGTNTLNPGKNCAIDVTFIPTARGAVSTTMTIVTSANTLNVLMTGEGVQSEVDLSPNFQTFDSPIVGQSTSRTFTLNNVGAQAQTIQSIQITGTNPSDFSQTNTCGNLPSQLAAGAQCQITVVFTPSAGGPRTATLTVQDDADNSPQSASLSGTGTPANPQLSWSTASDSFGTVNIGSSATHNYTLTNTGNVPVNNNVVQTSDDPNFILQSSPTCPSTLAVGQSCMVSVAFTPTTATDHSGRLIATNDANNSPQIVTLSGTGANPPPTVSITPNPLDFGNQTVGTSTTQPVTLVNTSKTTALNIQNIAVSNTGTSTDFALSQGSTTTCGSSLAAGASCTVGVTFTPSAIGPRTGNLTFTDDAIDSPQTVSLTGNGTFAFTGFLDPISNPPTVNEAKAGQAIPIQFSLGGDQGLNIFAANSPSTQSLTCNPAMPIDPNTPTVTAGNSGLQFDPTTNQYTYVWKTDKSMANTCQQLNVTLTDGTTHTALFMFK